MKYRESGMPEEALWENFFNPIEILKKLEVTEKVNTLIDVGCGYGTFLIPASHIVKENVIGIDIDEHYLRVCQERVATNDKVRLITGDITDIVKSAEGDIKLADYITLFNILHCEDPVQLFIDAAKLIKVGGKVGVIHWINDDTPRGPSLEIRPSPNQIIKWAKDAHLSLEKQVAFPPYHFGMLFNKIN
ncbi:class I SAM-dependent methyltransferase [Evansella cellulosilytica]|uniref:Methyltransferase type 12 n=1 Tax=Evansella cellulosilytica (strain ATCC 21833 / DSM 2522 / FERM P-1141 / JCM 9156 / N-4) TaxID=649639 RepID=E6TU71_EVAC2|nr:class I SAM-dependent methyltransferase [Evansella cellulosilytica]ADU28531.1 Methyltransferase type 12 [Evansella cellulosilytica DSM 2522]